MTPQTPPPVDKNTPAPNPAVRILLGLGLSAPALLCCLAQLVLPTFSTFILSLQEPALIQTPDFVGGCVTKTEWWSQ